MNTNELESLLSQVGSVQKTGEYAKAELMCRQAITTLEQPEMDNDDVRYFKAELYRLLAVSLYSRGNYDSSQYYLESALGLFQMLGNMPGVARTLNNIGVVYFHRSDFQRALEYYRRALSIEEELDNKAGMANHIGNMGIVYAHLSDYGQAIEHYRLAIALNEELNDIQSVARHTGNMGLIYYRVGDYQQALELYQKALGVDEEIGNKAGVARHLGNLGLVYSSLFDYDNALEYYTKSLAIAEELGNKASMAHQTSNIGSVYRSLLDYDQAMEYHRKALSIFEEIGNMEGVATATGHIGNVYLNIAEFFRALEYMQKASELFEKIGNKAGMAIWLFNIGNIYAAPDFKESDHKVAQEFLSKAENIFEELGMKREQCEFHRLMSEICEKEERWEEFAKHFREYHKLEQEIRGEESRKSAVRFQLQILQKEREIERLKNIELAEANARLRQLDNEKNEFIGMAAHDLKNPLTAIILQASLASTRLDGLTPNQLLKSFKSIHHSAERMLEIILRFLDVNALDSEGVTAEFSPTDITQITRDIVEHFSAAAEKKKITLNYHPPVDTMTVQTDPAILEEILENLVSNAIKFSPHGRKVSIEIESIDSTETDEVHIIVRDQGPGIKPEDMDKLFGRFQRLSARPTGGEHSTGLGLAAVKRLTELIGGSVWCESVAGNGAAFFVKLPRNHS